MNDLTQQLTRLLADLDELTQQAANRANSAHPDSADLSITQRAYFHGVSFGYEDSRDKVAALLVSALKTTVSE
jgi:hypothetical protein